ncbi:putative UPF0481 protein At3g02645 [Lathyrus oleraceus]|uniref:putative UPF0481 protein At3g02645 n=1 Tax=Pisum sativum TaxID=3888 RepID=UPI0021D3DC12|nr:putative UPF0481 protein At3g02645 [Pisum sativum]
MASNAVAYTDEQWVIDICKSLLPEVEQNTHDEIIVSVSQVPKSLRSSNPEAFIPQFIGLGPYHHYKSDLIMNDKLKLDSSKRALKHLFHHFDTETLKHRLKSILSHSYIQAFYHIDVASKYPYQTLLYLLTVDGLFLLGLLHRALTIKPQQDQQYSYFLTGKHGISMVNSAGVELTMNFIVRDVFMLENQIPTHFLKQVNTALVTITRDEIESSLEKEAHQNLGPSMRLFCESLCPFVHEFQLTKNPENHAHLLDLMYHLIVPNHSDPEEPPRSDLKLEIKSNPEPQFDSESKSTPQSKLELEFTSKSQSESESKSKLQSKLESESTSKPQSESEPKPAIQSELKLKPEPHNQPNDKKKVSYACSICFNFLAIFVAICIIIGFIIKFIFTIFFWILKTLFSFVKWALRPLVKLLDIINPFVEVLYDFLSKNETKFSYIKPWTKIVGEIKKTSENVRKEDYSTNWDNNISNVSIPSVTELNNAGIKFQPSDISGNGISSIDFDEIKCQFYLPVIKLDMNSEVIIRNLMAYESLIESKGLIFTRYIELMRAIIDTPEDVKLLVNEKIIETEMSYEGVAQLFNGLMGKSIRPIKVQKLDQVIKRVNAKFKSSQAQKMAMIKYMSSYGKMLTALAAIVFLVLTAVQTYCSAFGCARNSNYMGSSSMYQDGDYVRNVGNVFMSSM